MTAECEPRREAIVAAPLSILARRWRSYEAAGGQRLIRPLDTVLLSVTKGLVTAKRVLRRALSVRQLPLRDSIDL